MLCIKCKTELPEGAAFCHICGKKQTTGEKKRSSSSRPNGTGSVYRRGKTWECAVTLGYVIDDNGKRRAVRPTKGGFKTKKEAMEYIPTLRNAPTRKIPNLIDLWETYKTSKKYQKLGASRKEKYDIAWKKLESLWFCKIDELTTFDLQNAVDSNADTYYTARDLKDLLSKLYQTAMPDEYVKSNLSKFIELPDLNAKEQQPFHSDEIAKLWTDYTGGNWWTGYILLMIYTGMMPGELLDARKAHIDWEGKQIVGAGKKTAKRRETPIVLADVVLPVLADLCEHTKGDKLIRINKDRFYETYYEALERAGCRRLTPYSCRHTAATELTLENIPPSVIQKIMRHARYSTTEKYIHISIDPMLEAVNKLPKTIDS
ncbi:MAG: tyrosine-type recombinase/integrase [Oscillospiraceae bacterium]|nr:tyrosine-type recombinase/integrase [Oscillospiraceae bacterium]